MCHFLNLFNKTSNIIMNYYLLIQIIVVFNTKNVDVYWSAIVQNIIQLI